MLQYIVHSSDRKQMLDEAHQALKGGCQWIELNPPSDMPDELLREVVEILKPDIQAVEGCLILASRVKLAKELSVDGVQLYAGDIATSAARTELDAGPIIGLSVECLDEVKNNLLFDIDYFRFEPLCSDGKHQFEELEKISKFLLESKCDKPLAVAGGVTSKTIPKLFSVGADGVAVDSSNIENDLTIDAAIRDLLKVIISNH